MLIDLSEILSSEGLVKEYTIKSDLKEFSFNGNVYAIDVIPEFTLTAKNEGKRKASIYGGCKATLRLLCDRCLDEVKMDFDVEIEETIDMEIFKSDKIDEINELNYLDDCNIDMDALLEKELMSLVPVQVLCKDDCKGLCKVCGTNLNHGSCDCDDFVPDPRLSVFANILKD
ncbi:MAG: YceD family protein [Coprococcus sp.]